MYLEVNITWLNGELMPPRSDLLISHSRPSTHSTSQSPVMSPIYTVYGGGNTGGGEGGVFSSLVRIMAFHRQRHHCFIIIATLLNFTAHIRNPTSVRPLYIPDSICLVVWVIHHTCSHPAESSSSSYTSIHPLSLTLSLTLFPALTGAWLLDFQGVLLHRLVWAATKLIIQSNHAL